MTQKEKEDLENALGLEDEEAQEKEDPKIEADNLVENIHNEGEAEVFAQEEKRKSRVPEAMS